MKGFLIVICTALGAYLVINVFLQEVYPGGFCGHLPPEWAAQSGCLTFRMN